MSLITTPATQPLATRTTIRPIETVYNGYWFRSRLEARWAVFFEKIGITFQYEPEGFHLEDGTMYLPDFFLPQVRTWAEVKPVNFTQPQYDKCEMLARGTRRGCLMLPGPPEAIGYQGVDYVSSAEFPSHGYYSLDVCGFSKKPYESEGRLWWEGQPGAYSLDLFSPQYTAAVLAARQERFTREKGQMPPLGMEPFNVDPKELMEGWK